MACCCGNPCPDLQKCGTECCAEDHTCCNGATCCAPGQTCCEAQCCNGDQVCCEGSCCAPNQYCCGDACCDGFNSCCEDNCCSFADCSWTENRFASENGNYDQSFRCGDSIQTVNQEVYPGYAPDWFGDFGGEWKPGYPAALAGCPWALVYDLALSTCFAASPSDPEVGLCVFDVKWRWRIFKATCNKIAVDISATALQGPTEGVVRYGVDIGQPCTQPADPPFLDFFDDPEIFCPP